MERRDFLKTLGLGGLALTLPKPLSVFAAKASDLTDPPIHAGLCRFRDLENFPIYDLGLKFPDHISADRARFYDFTDHCRINMVIRRDNRSYIPILENSPTLSRMVVPSTASDGFINPGTPHGPGLIPGASLNTMKGDFLEVWVVSDDKAKYPIPPMRVILYGPPKPSPDYLGQVLRVVRLERTRAIEMGVASPSDPFEAL